MSDPTFTILMPVVRSPELMMFAIDSILGQTRGDFELFIVCDGAPPETAAAGHRRSQLDSRVRVFEFPKGERHGEAHRHIALEQARGRYVCQLGDDDFWFPEHLEEMAALLAKVEFGNVLEVTIGVDGTHYLDPADLADPYVQSKMLAEIWYRFGPTNAGYRMETYRRLPVGWSPAPRNLPTDLFMWRKFLALPGIVAGTRFVISSIRFGTDHRPGWPIERRREEMVRYAEIIASKAGRDEIRNQALRRVAREYVARHEYIHQLESSAHQQRMELAKVAAELARAQTELGEGTAELAAARTELSSLWSSWSWRLTAPMRAMTRLALRKP